MASNASKTINKALAPTGVLVGIGAVVVLLLFALIVTVNLTLQSNAQTESVLVESVKSELVATSVSAREIISRDIDLFNRINSREDVLDNWDSWLAVVEDLRRLGGELGAEYIYALKEVNGEYFFVYDTDEETQAAGEFFMPYELSSVHEEAFAGNPAAGIMNVVDEWGSFNTGAVPLFDAQGRQIGIVSTDIADDFIHRNQETSSFYATLLIVTMSTIVIVLLVILFILMRRNLKMQQRLYRLANFDPISGLPNRNNLFTTLATEIHHFREHQHPFAVIFVDLDNFKSVNDNAGHDTGDVLLRTIATFLDSFALSSAYSSANGLDALTARIGGDEFLQLLPDVPSEEKAAEYTQALLDAFAQEPSLQRFISEFSVGLSIGVALFPSMQTDYDQLIKFADIAMYYAKHDGKNGFKIYDPSMGDDVDDAELIVRTKRGSR